VATVNGVVIPQAAYDLLAARAKAQGAQDSPQLAADLRGRLIQAELLQPGRQEEEPGPQARGFPPARHGPPADHGQHLRGRICPESPDHRRRRQGQYDRIVAQAGGKEYKSRHILVKEEKPSTSSSA
jgi:peptidyl-prolyl cis-trans isomerase C